MTALEVAKVSSKTDHLLLNTN